MICCISRGESADPCLDNWKHELENRTNCKCVFNSESL